MILDLLTLGLPVLTGLTGRFNVLEIEQNIERKLPGAHSVWREYLPKLKLEVVPVPSSWDMALLGDMAEAKDLPVIASAINGKADYLVSGDSRLSSRLGHRPDILFRAAVPAEFLNVLLPEILARKR
jgi:predicted nucleic acid-binding protein